MKVELPQDFHERLIDLENQVMINSSLELIEELTTLYKVYLLFTYSARG
jgi:hypothetical protein